MASAATPPESPVPPPSLEPLRALVSAPERRRLRALEELLRDPAYREAFVAEALPKALARQAGDPLVGLALKQPVQEALRDAARTRPELFAETLAPVIGAAIRKAIAAALAAMLERLTQTMQHSLSPRSLLWRLEARHTGRPYAEVVLLRTLRFRVEQVLLVHRASGVLLGQVQAEGVVSLDPVQVSGLLTALRDFAREAFQQRGALETLQVGDLDVWIEAGSDLLVAAVIRGHPPAWMRGRMKETLERIELESSAALQSFKGDLRPFEASLPRLAELLETPAEEGQDQRDARRLVSLGSVATLVLVLVAAWLWEVHRSRVLLTEALEAIPGIVVTDVEREGGRWRVSGLRDPLATPPKAALTDPRLARLKVDSELTPFVSLEPELVLERARRRLTPPASVRFSLQGDVLVATGVAPAVWLAQAKEQALLVPGVRGFDDSQLAQQEALDEARSLAIALDRTRVGFVSGTATLTAAGAAELEALVSGLRRLLALQTPARRTLAVTLIGSVGHGLTPQLALSRAARIEEVLLEEGLSAASVRVGPAEEKGPHVTVLLRLEPRGGVR